MIETSPLLAPGPVLTQERIVLEADASAGVASNTATAPATARRNTDVIRFAPCLPTSTPSRCPSNCPGSSVPFLVGRFSCDSFLLAPVLISDSRKLLSEFLEYGRMYYRATSRSQPARRGTRNRPPALTLGFDPSPAMPAKAP